MRSRTYMINDYVMAAWFTTREEALAKADDQWVQYGWENRGDATYDGKPAIRLTHGRGGSQQTEYLVIAPVNEWPDYVQWAA